MERLNQKIEKLFNEIIEFYDLDTIKLMNREEYSDFVKELTQIVREQMTISDYHDWLANRSAIIG